MLSEPGQGATFEIYLPPVIEDEIEDAPPARVQTCDGHERILLVEDEPDVREVAAAMLSRFGYTVVTAPDGNAAFRRSGRRRTSPLPWC